jgi:N-acyl homoserine lactone hydrolase
MARAALTEVAVLLHLLDGDAAIAPGLYAIATPGHTPGHQSFGIDHGSRRIVLAFDAADLRANLDERRAPGWTVDPQDVAAADQSVGRLADLDALPGVEVWPGHDPQWWAWRTPHVVRRESRTTIPTRSTR